MYLSIKSKENSARWTVIIYTSKLVQTICKRRSAKKQKFDFISKTLNKNKSKY